MNTQKGFTLIELLVVIAIIGILSGIVLTALNGARDKAKDAELKSDMAGFRTAAELYYNSASPNAYAQAMCAPGTVGGTDLVSKTTGPYYAGIDKANGTTAPAGTVTCVVNGNFYAISSPLPSDSTKSFCVDSSGVSKEGSVAQNTGKCN